MENMVNKKLKDGQCVFGAFMEVNSLEMAEILSKVGFDFILIDAEHGSMNIETAGRQVSIIKSTDTVPFLRVPWNDLVLVKRGLDTGAYGIMFPMINTKEDAQKAVKYSYYPPRGIRGFGAGRANLYFNNPDEYTDFANNDLSVIVQIESIEAVNNIEEILSVEGIDIAFVGPYDLSYTMGKNGNVNDPEVEAAIDKVLKACNKFGVTAGILTSMDKMEKHKKDGFRFIIGGIDAQFLYNGAKESLDKFRKL